MATGETPPPGGSPPPRADYALEAYKLLADMFKQEESVFWMRNQLFLLLNSGLVAILVGILGLQSKQPKPPDVTPTAPVAQPVTPAGPGQPPPVYFQQILYTPPSSPAGLRPAAVYLPLLLVSALGAVLCALWPLIVARGQVLNDHLVEHMKQLERTRLPGIDNFTKADEFLVDRLDPFGARATTRRWRRFVNWLGERMRISTAWLIIAVAFFFIWVILLLWVVLIWTGFL